VSHGFYLTYDGPYPSLSELQRFWEDTAAAAGLTGGEPWERTGDVVEHVVSTRDLDVELAIFLDGQRLREVSVEGHWSENATPVAYHSVLASARSFAAATGGRLEDFDAGAPL
jgi:hypothetical protein